MQVDSRTGNEVDCDIRGFPIPQGGNKNDSWARRAQETEKDREGY